MRRILKITAIFLLTALLLPMLFSCGARRFEEYSFEYFDTLTAVTGYESSEASFKENCAAVMAILEEYHKLYDIYQTYDGVVNLATLNSHAGKGALKVDEKIIDLLSYAKDMYTLTGGKTNIALGSVLSIWHDCREAGLDKPESARLPSREELKLAAAHTDIDSIVINTDTSTVEITDKAVQIDVGAIGKGYAVEMAARELERRGATGYIINVGGNVRAVGEKGEGEPFIAGIENPDSEDYIETVKLKNAALVTSGSYQRYYTVEGVNYHHIIDPETLMPKNEFKSVSVIAEHSGMADALSTALFVMDIEEGRALVESISGVEALWLTANGEIIKSGAFSDYT